MSEYVCIVLKKRENNGGYEIYDTNKKNVQINKKKFSILKSNFQFYNIRKLLTLFLK